MQTLVQRIKQTLNEDDIAILQTEKEGSNKFQIYTNKIKVVYDKISAIFIHHNHPPYAL